MEMESIRVIKMKKEDREFDVLINHATLETLNHWKDKIERKIAEKEEGWFVYDP